MRRPLYNGQAQRGIVLWQAGACWVLRLAFGRLKGGIRWGPFKQAVKRPKKKFRSADAEFFRLLVPAPGVLYGRKSIPPRFRRFIFFLFVCLFWRLPWRRQARCPSARLRLKFRGDVPCVRRVPKSARAPRGPQGAPQGAPRGPLGAPRGPLGAPSPARASGPLGPGDPGFVSL